MWGKLILLFALSGVGGGRSSSGLRLLLFLSLSLCLSLLKFAVKVEKHKFRPRQTHWDKQKPQYSHVLETISPVTSSRCIAGTLEVAMMSLLVVMYGTGQGRMR